MRVVRLCQSGLSKSQDSAFEIEDQYLDYVHKEE